MGEFIKHEACPDCGSKDNVAVYDDGKYCFGCGWVQSMGKILNFTRKMEKKEAKPAKVVSLPKDYNYAIPLYPRSWLHKYDLYQSEIVEHRICWSEINKYLIFPVHNKDHKLVMWQARTFRESIGRNTVPKYITVGDKESVLHIIGAAPKKEHLVIVEDMVSAIKVARICPSMPLFGSTLSDERAMKLAQKYQSIIIWLDKDKWSQSVKYCNQFKYIFEHIGLVSTTEDPKLQTTATIKDKLHWYTGD